MSDIKLFPPCSGTITQRFGENPDLYSKFGLPGHAGLDWGVPSGTLVRAMADGTVDKVGFEPGGFGNYVKIRHTHPKGLYYTYLAHLSLVSVKAKDKVLAGDIVGYSGSTGNSTGPHVHAELRCPWEVAPGYPRSIANIERFMDFGGVTPPPNPPPNPTGVVIVNNARLNVRTAAGLTTKIIGTVTYGTSLEACDGQIVEEDGLEWVVVKAYVAKKYVVIK